MPSQAQQKLNSGLSGSPNAGFVMSGYWYEYTYTECVLCGASSIRKERQYTPKPTDKHKIHFYVQECCGHHFT